MTQYKLYRKTCAVCYLNMLKTPTKKLPVAHMHSMQLPKIAPPPAVRKPLGA